MNAQARANGVDDLVELDAAAVRRLEPRVNGAAALLSPSSGVVDALAYMCALLHDAVAHGVIFLPCTPIADAEPVQGSWRVGMAGAVTRNITARLVINAAGLHAVGLSARVFPRRKVPRFAPTKASYARLEGPSPVRHIIYPALIPGQIEERVDATPGLDGVLRFGPSVEEARGLDDFDPNP